MKGCFVIASLMAATLLAGVSEANAFTATEDALAVVSYKETSKVQFSNVRFLRRVASAPVRLLIKVRQANKARRSARREAGYGFFAVRACASCNTSHYSRTTTTIYSRGPAVPPPPSNCPGGVCPTGSCPNGACP